MSDSDGSEYPDLEPGSSRECSPVRATSRDLFVPGTAAVNVGLSGTQPLPVDLWDEGGAVCSVRDAVAAMHPVDGAELAAVPVNASLLPVNLGDGGGPVSGISQNSEQGQRPWGQPGRVQNDSQNSEQGQRPWGQPDGSIQYQQGMDPATSRAEGLRLDGGESVDVGEGSRRAPSSRAWEPVAVRAEGPLPATGGLRGGVGLGGGSALGARVFIMVDEGQGGSNGQPAADRPPFGPAGGVPGSPGAPGPAGPVPSQGGAAPEHPLRRIPYPLGSTAYTVLDMRRCVNQVMGMMHAEEHGKAVPGVVMAAVGRYLARTAATAIREQPDSMRLFVAAAKPHLSIVEGIRLEQATMHPIYWERVVAHLPREATGKVVTIALLVLGG